MALTGRKIGVKPIFYVDNRLGLRYVRRQVPINCCVKNPYNLLHYEQDSNFEFYPQKVSFCDNSYIQFVSNMQNNQLQLRKQDDDELLEVLAVEKVPNQDFVIAPIVANTIEFVDNTEFGQVGLLLNNATFNLNGGVTNVDDIVAQVEGKIIAINTVDGYYFIVNVQKATQDTNTLIWTLIIEEDLNWQTFPSPYINQFDYTLRADRAYYYQLEGTKYIDWFEVKESYGVSCYYLCLAGDTLEAIAEDSNPNITFKTTTYSKVLLRTEPIQVLPKSVQEANTVKIEYYGIQSSRDDGSILFTQELVNTKLFVRVEGDFQALAEGAIEDENYRLSTGQYQNIYASDMSATLLNIRPQVQQYVHELIKAALRTADVIEVNNVTYSASTSTYDLGTATQKGVRGATARLLKQASTTFNRN